MLEYIDDYTKARLAECQTRTEELNVLAFMRLENKKMYTYLDNLRSSGITNMLGAGQYLVNEFNITSSHARDVLKSWMDNVSD